MSVNSEQITLLQGFVELCQHNPQVLRSPELSFYKSWLESLGASIPEPTTGTGATGDTTSSHGQPKAESKPKAHDGRQPDISKMTSSNTRKRASDDPDPLIYVEFENLVTPEPSAVVSDTRQYSDSRESDNEGGMYIHHRDTEKGEKEEEEEEGDMVENTCGPCSQKSLEELTNSVFPPTIHDMKQSIQGNMLAPRFQRKRIFKTLGRKEELNQDDTVQTTGVFKKTFEKKRKSSDSKKVLLPKKSASASSANFAQKVVSIENESQRIETELQHDQKVRGKEGTEASTVITGAMEKNSQVDVETRSIEWVQILLSASDEERDSDDTDEIEIQGSQLCSEEPDMEIQPEDIQEKLSQMTSSFNLSLEHSSKALVPEHTTESEVSKIQSVDTMEVERDIKVKGTPTLNVPQSQESVVNLYISGTVRESRSALGHGILDSRTKSGKTESQAKLSKSQGGGESVGTDSRSMLKEIKSMVNPTSITPKISSRRRSGVRGVRGLASRINADKLIQISSSGKTTRTTKNKEPCTIIESVTPDTAKNINCDRDETNVVMVEDKDSDESDRKKKMMENIHKDMAMAAACANDLQLPVSPICTPLDDDEPSPFVVDDKGDKDDDDDDDLVVVESDAMTRSSRKLSISSTDSLETIIYYMEDNEEFQRSPPSIKKKVVTKKAKPLSANYMDSTDEEDDTVCSESEKKRRRRRVNWNKTHPCDVREKGKRCGKKFPCPSKLKVHQHTHTGERPYECTLCGQQFFQKSNLNSHQRLHTGEKPYQCTLCGWRFSNSSNFKKHQALHTGEKPYECSACGKRFRQKIHLTTHERLHTGDKPYTCSVCGKGCATSFGLTVHHRIHTGEKPYKCRLCGKNFNSTSSCTTHERTHTGEKPYRCSVCDKRYTQQSTLTVHENIHTGEKPYTCSVCDKIFAWPSDLSKHKGTHTGEAMI